MHGHKKLRKLLLAGSMTMFLFLYGIVGIEFPFIKNESVNAQSPERSITGWAWSDNIGWVSFSCEDTNSCGSVDYGVYIDGSNNLTGFAWSDNVGWLKFGGLSSFPSGGSVQSNAKLSGNNIEGWARFCAGTINGDCTSMTNHPDGWDGWVSLSGTVSDSDDGYYSIIQGYIWGSTVVGWSEWKPEFGGVQIGDGFEFAVEGPTEISLGKDDSSDPLDATAVWLAGTPEEITFSIEETDWIKSAGFPNGTKCTPTSADDCTKGFRVKTTNLVEEGKGYDVFLVGTSASGEVKKHPFTVSIPVSDAVNSITCSANPTSAKTGEVVTWAANISPVGSYTVNWQENGTDVGSGSSIERTYSTVGTRNMLVSVAESEKTATCSITIQKNPNYVEF